VRGDLAIKIFGPDLDELDALAQRIATAVQGIRGSEDVVAAQNTGVQYLQVALDRQALGRAGLSVESVQNDLRALVEGRTVGVVVEQGRRLPLIVRGPEALQNSSTLFHQLGCRSAARRRSALGARESGDRRRTGKDRTRKFRAHGPVRANVRDRDLVGFVAEAQAAVARDVPRGGYHLMGRQQNQQRTAADWRSWCRSPSD
jgi:cobalt-zinc-cadmium resistance protein CzcA